MQRIKQKHFTSQDILLEYLVPKQQSPGYSDLYQMESNYTYEIVVPISYIQDACSRSRMHIFQEGQLSVTGESMCTKYWLTA